MIRKLQLKFVAVCMALVTAVLAAVVVSVYISVDRSVEALSRQVLHQVMQDSDNGLFRPEIGLGGQDDRVLLPYFTVNVWGGAAYVTGGTYADLEDTAALQEILNDCLSQNQTEGLIRNYHLRYLRQDNGLYEKLAFVDISMEQAMMRGMLGLCLLIAFLSLLLLLGVSVLLSRWAVRPVEKAWRQQRQFLSDASHELKTPLTVILSNAELLEAAELTEKPARWADNIRSEAHRMKTLVEEMLTLARADSAEHTIQRIPVSLSDLAEDCALAFEPVAFESGKALEADLAEDVTVPGDGEQLYRLISILLDNAVKHGAAGGAIRLTLQKTERQAVLTVSNPGEPLSPEQLSHLFERFYQTDASRGEQSGFGLGLSIAKTIAEAHRGTLTAESDPQSTRFSVALPLQR